MIQTIFNKQESATERQEQRIKRKQTRLSSAVGVMAVCVRNKCTRIRQPVLKQRQRIHTESQGIDYTESNQ